jgi:hypothetical protein
MPKLHLEIAHQVPHSHRRARAMTIGLIVALGMLVIPVLVELGKLCVAQWYEVAGKRYVVRTPILDLIRARFDGARDDLGDLWATHLYSVTWNAEFVFPILVLLLVIGVLLLRR